MADDELLVTITGDGLTDVSTAVRQAVNDALTAGKLALRFPSGRYPLGSVTDLKGLAFRGGRDSCLWFDFKVKAGKPGVFRGRLSGWGQVVLGPTKPTVWSPDPSAFVVTWWDPVGLEWCASSLPVQVGDVEVTANISALGLSCCIVRV